MTRMVSRWPSLVRIPLRDGETGADGRLTPAAVERLFRAGWEAFRDGGATLAGVEVDLRIASARATGAPGPGVEEADVAVAAVEVYGDRFTVSARIQVGTGRVDAEGAAVVAGGVTTAIRDELIARSHGAQHVL